MNVAIDGMVCDSVKTRFGIREIVSNQDTPDRSRQFYVNGKKIFVRGTNWIPEAMLRMSDERTYAELRYTKQSGINLIRFWGGGIAESDYFYQLCDEMGFLVWQEFWMTGDTKHPHDKSVYLGNMESTVKRIRNHPSLAYYVSSNESTEMPGAEALINRIDGTRGYQMQSECCGVHDGSPYKQVNPMQHYENTASERGSRIDGFNPEYGAPTLPLAETLREMMDEKDLWPINKEVWDYHDGGGFHLMSTMYKELTDKYGQSSTIDEFATKGQFVGAMNSKSIWECWNYNKYGFGDRYASGLLFWYHQCPVPQVAGRMWDYTLEPTASLYHTQNALEPLHPQFDYLKNTVSVYNDYYQSFKGYKVLAEVYDIKSRKVGSNFYWRSRDKYEGAKTLTGPATSGFESIDQLPEVKLSAKYKTRTENGSYFIDVELKNVSRNIAFFTQIQFLGADNKPVRPSFYTDNFFSLLPGESYKITIDTSINKISENSLVIKGWNVKGQRFKLK